MNRSTCKAEWSSSELMWAVKRVYDFQMNHYSTFQNSGWRVGYIEYFRVLILQIKPNHNKNLAVARLSFHNEGSFVKIKTFSSK